MSREALTHVNFWGADWAYLKQYLEHERDVSIQVICGMNTTVDETNLHRGKIMFIKTLLGQAEAIIKAKTSGDGR